ncbi:MAG: hypothetical protein ACLFRL_06455 [Desulfohalobiaceae bacterium]
MAAEIRSILLAGILLFLICALLLSVSSCGRKKWPSPQTQEETFSWGSVEVQRKQDCLRISAELEGKSSNLRDIVLQLESRQEPCPDCPFQPETSIRLARSSKQVQQSGSQLQIEHCGLEPDLSYRLRLKGQNAFPSLQPAASRVIRVGEP